MKIQKSKFKTCDERSRTIQKGMAHAALLLLVFNFCLLTCFAQQDAQYSQYMFNPLALNPAYAGIREVFSSALVYRNQWTGIDGDPSTASLSVQTPLGKKNAGAGVELLSDKLGFKSTSAALFSYSYHVNVLKGKLSAGLRMGMYDYAYDWGKAKVKDASDIYNTGSRSSKITGTADFGLYYYTRTFYWGLAMSHLNRGKIADVTSTDSTARQSVHFFMPVGKAFEVGSVILNPSLLIKGAGKSPVEADVNMNVLLKERLWLGMSYRSGYGMVFLTQYLISDKFKAGYSFDYGMNKIGVAGKGTHEIMIGYDLNVKGEKMEMLRYF